MTTNETRRLSAYEVLEQLQRIEPSEATKQVTADVLALIEQSTDLLVRAREILIEHDAAANRIIEGVAGRVGDRDRIDDGLYALLTSLSGCRELHDAMERFAMFADPTTLIVPEAVPSR